MLKNLEVRLEILDVILSKVAMEMIVLFVVSSLLLNGVVSF